MPYLESNQDVSENSTFNKALAVLGTVTFAAAAGQMAIESIAKKWGLGGAKNELAKLGEKATERDVIKSLYGKEAELNAKDYERIWKRAGDNRIPIASKNGAQYTLNTSEKGVPSFKRTGGGSAWDRFRENYGGKWLNNGTNEMQNLNKQMKNMWKNKEGYTNSKLDIYADLVGNKGNLNIGSDDFVEASNNIYSSEGNSAIRRQRGWNDNTYKQEIDWMNKMWGDDSLSPSEKVANQSKEKAEQAEEKAIQPNSDDSGALTQEQLKELGLGEQLPNRPSYRPSPNESDDFLGLPAENKYVTDTSHFFKPNDIPTVGIKRPVEQPIEPQQDIIDLNGLNATGAFKNEPTFQEQLRAYNYEQHAQDVENAIAGVPESYDNRTYQRLKNSGFTSRKGYTDWWLDNSNSPNQ